MAALSGCAGQTNDGMKSEYRTLQECISGIQSSSGNTLKIITDTPDEVSGFLANGQGFACEKKVSGTKGVYFEGWYLIK